MVISQNNGQITATEFKCSMRKIPRSRERKLFQQMSNILDILSK